MHRRPLRSGDSSMTNQTTTHTIREVVIQYVGAHRRILDKITKPGQVVTYLRRRLQDHSREHFVAIYLDARNQPIADRIVSIGTATMSIVHPREVFQPAVALGACGLIIAHNHPSGEATPSTEDRKVTKRLAEAGQLLGILLFDHVIWTQHGPFTSLRETDGSLFTDRRD